MVDIVDKKDCCGCTACASICAQNAITMEPDALGFFYPKVNIEKCINCGRCDQVCSFNDNYDTSLNLPVLEAYGVRHKNKEEIMNSRSGAMFVAISDFVIEKGGVVYGVGMKERFRATHIRAVTKSERDELRGSKYMQSDLNGIFNQIKSDLKAGLFVLFSGTPCQTSGLNSFVGKNLRKKLLLVDIVCHGVPGPYLWRDYIKYLENKYQDTICEVVFRDKKRYGWRAHRESFRFEKGGWKSFNFTLYKRNIFRQSCGECHFCNIKRPSDITLADFWHAEKIAPEYIADNKGANLILINTVAGQELFNAVKDKLNYIPVNIEKCMQGNLIHPAKLYPKLLSFENYYAIYGFEETMKHFGEIGWRHDVRMKTTCVIKNIKSALKKIKSHLIIL